MELKANVNFDRFEGQLQVVDATQRESSAVSYMVVSRSRKATQ